MGLMGRDLVYLLDQPGDSPGIICPVTGFPDCLSSFVHGAQMLTFAIFLCVEACCTLMFSRDN